MRRPRTRDVAALALAAITTVIAAPAAAGVAPVQDAEAPAATRQTAQERLLSGLELLEAGRGEEAVAALREAVGLDGASAEARYHLARALLATGADATEAVEHLLAALDVGGDEGPVRFLLAQAYLELERWVDADAALRAAEAARPGYPPITAYRGHLCYRLGRSDAAKALFEAAAEAAPRWEVPRARLGTIALGAGDVEEAIAQFRAAIERSPENPILWVRLGTAYAAINDTAQSLDAYRSAAEAGPEFLPAWMAYARQLENLAEYEALPAVIDHLLDLRPGMPFALYLRAVLASNRGEHEAALADIDAALTEWTSGASSSAGTGDEDGQEGRQNIAAAFVLRAELLGKLGRQQEAEAAARRAVEENPDYPQSYFILGNLLLRRRDPSGREVLTRFKALNDASEHRDLALYYLDQVDDIDRADAEFDAALEDVAADVPSLLGKARIARRRGDDEAALGFLGRARERGATQADLFRESILALDALGRREEAISAWQEARAAGVTLGPEVWRVVYRDVEVSCEPGASNR